MKKLIITTIFILVATIASTPSIGNRPAPVWFVHWIDDGGVRKRQRIYPAYSPDEALKKFRADHGDVLITCLAMDYYNICTERTYF